MAYHIQDSNLSFSDRRLPGLRLWPAEVLTGAAGALYLGDHRLRAIPQ
jgi:hypothetical protein